mmetsp:Transcript_36004/g.102820  ORF Transcript_36004/g.102820 Transcript_36004/m.102820 type:complete len:398 (-) Transcript_36004:30-1223(-)
MAAPAMRPWGTCQRDGKEVQVLTLTADSGARVEVCTYGATLLSLEAPDREGRLGDVMLGFADLESYEAHCTYLSCAVGRVCSRIAGGKFRLGDEEFQLPQNNGTACHHGGPVGFSHHTWDIVDLSASSVTLRLESPDMDQGFPGRVAVTVQYTLLPVEGNSTALSIRFRAETDRTTVVNLTNHAYFNLAGFDNGGADDLPQKMLDHIVTIAADTYVPTDEGNIPLGEFRSVGGTPFDFRTAAKIGARIEEDDAQLKIAAGYDHNMALREAPASGSPPAAEATVGGVRPLGVECDDSGRWTRARWPDAVADFAATGRRLEVFTEEPAVHFYSGNYLNCEPSGTHLVPKAGVPISRRAGFCFETQHFTDSPNQPAFPSVVLEPGQTWRTETVFWFSTSA